MIRTNKEMSHFTASEHNNIVKVPLISELRKAGDVAEEEFQHIHMKHLKLPMLYRAV
jgi:hypothetical protein